MTNHRLGSAPRHQRAFTLVEIGVVLVITVLLLGSALKSLELMASARANHLISSMNGHKAAIDAFQDRYRMLAGASRPGALHHTLSFQTFSHEKMSPMTNHSAWHRKARRIKRVSLWSKSGWFWAAIALLVGAVLRSRR